MKVKKSLDIDILIFSVFVRQTSTGHSTVGNTSTALYCVLYTVQYRASTEKEECLQ